MRSRQAILGRCATTRAHSLTGSGPKPLFAEQRTNPNHPIPTIVQDPLTFARLAIAFSDLPVFGRPDVGRTPERPVVGRASIPEVARNECPESSRSTFFKKRNDGSRMNDPKRGRGKMTEHYEAKGKAVYKSTAKPDKPSLNRSSQR